MTISKLLNFFSKNYPVIKELGIIQFLSLRRKKKFQKTYAYLRKNKMELVDSSTFLTLVNEIFGEEVYKFNTNEATPVIFDCGANIGLATIYFKMRFPNSIVYSFEPDTKIFSALEFNIRSFNLTGVHLYNKAVSDKNGEVSFEADGGLSGRINDDNNKNQNTVVKSVRLKELLQAQERVDFLKIDIEGYEEILFPDIMDELKKVQYLFIEYHSFINKQQSLDKILKGLSNNGFRYYIKESEFKKDPFINRVLFHDMDTVVNIFSYRN